MAMLKGDFETVERDGSVDVTSRYDGFLVITHSYLQPPPKARYKSTLEPIKFILISSSSC